MREFVPGTVTPNENAFDVGIAICQDGFFAVERTGEFFKDSPQRFGHALLRLPIVR